MRDRMWFFFNHRRIDSADAQPGIFANKNAGDPTKLTYVPDFTRQGRIDQSRKIYSLRLTTQITPQEQADAVLGRAAAVQRRGMAGQPDDDQAACRNKDGWIYGGSQNNGFFGRRPELAGDRRLRRHAPEGAAGEVHVACHQQAAARGRLRHLYLAVGISRSGRATRRRV